MNYKEYNYKNILIITAGKINDADDANNGLLFRNLFSSWPKQKIAQIYNSGNNGDKGYFGRYYQLDKEDRYFGKLYKKLYKANTTSISNDQDVNSLLLKTEITQSNKYISKLKLIFNKCFIETGLYELIFRPKLSTELKNWIDDFNPDLILMQGYSLTFSSLPLLIKSYKKVPLIFFTTDDWPSYLYNYKLNKHHVLSFIPRLMLNQKMKQVIRDTDIPIAFGKPMQVEYTKRYNKLFNYIIHCDEPQRFEEAPVVRLYDTSVKTIVAIGTFNSYRYPLIDDFNTVCRILKEKGMNYRLALISGQIDEKGREMIKEMEFVDIYDEPGNSRLPSLLKGADLLALIEGFDEEFAESIRLSISTKAHLFMFSKVPILVYANSITGISNYANEFKWANTVNKRDLNMLLENIVSLTQNEKLKEEKIVTAYETAMQYHNIHNVQNYFYSLLLEK